MGDSSKPGFAGRPVGLPPCTDRSADAAGRATLHNHSEAAL